MNDPHHTATGAEGTPERDPRIRPPRPPFSGRSWLIPLLLVVLVNVLFYSSALRGDDAARAPHTTIPYSVFLDQVRAGNVKTAQLSGQTASGDFIKPYQDAPGGQSYGRYSTTLLPVQDPTLVPLLQEHKVRITAVTQTTPFWLQALGLLLNALPLLLLLGLLYVGTRAARQQQQGVFGFGQSKAKLYAEERPSTTFADVAGVEAAKAELSEVVDFLRTPEKYQKLGAKIPRGVLLLGPPGTGKTLLARAVAGEAHVPFFSISSSEFVEMFVGVGASRVRDLFEKAKAAAPAIVFIDEIDAIGRHRGAGARFGGGTNDEREQTLNQLLVSLDGFDSTTNVIVLAATNRPDVLDPALLRPGRFDRQITVDPPDRRGREAILRVHTRKIPLTPTVDLGALAQATPGMSGADLANLANEAALTAARKGRPEVRPGDFEEALDRITLGAPGAALMNEDERRTVAYHEAGHALVAVMLPTADPVHRVTITPRGRSLGVTQFRPLDDRRNYRRDYLLDRLTVGLGGRAAEEMACGEITSGAQNDLQQVSAMARVMVTQLGMADELGLRSYGGTQDDLLGGQSYTPWEPREHSEETARRIDASIDRLIDEAHERARVVLHENRVTLGAIAAALMRDESLDQTELLDIIAEQRAPGTEPLPTPRQQPERLAGVAR